MHDRHRAKREREDLARADRHIAEGEKRLAEQRRLIARKTETGQDTAEADKLAHNFEETRERYYVHRQLILNEIARQEGSEPQCPGWQSCLRCAFSQR